jgi:hypothetical protein
MVWGKDAGASIHGPTPWQTETTGVRGNRSEAVTTSG